MIIYKITNKITGKCYIGQTTKSLEFRWAGHLTASSGCSALHNAIRKYGKENFSVEEIATYSNLEDLNNAEEYFIDWHNTLAPNGYNLNTGGNNKLASKELRKRMSKVQEGNHNKLGFKLTDETKQKMSTAKKGKPLSEKHKLALSIATKGRIAWNKGLVGVMPSGKDSPHYGKTFKHSQEAIEKIRIASLNMWSKRREEQK